MGQTIARLTSNKDDISLSKTDLRYAYNQLRLDKATAQHCYFSFMCGPATGTYQFQTRFCGVTNISADFQKAVDNTPVNIDNFVAYLDDISIVTENNIDSHREIVFVHLRLSNLNCIFRSIKASQKNCRFVNDMIYNMK